jgi:PIN domain nuclease of toxin-antitoxin system
MIYVLDACAMIALLRKESGEMVVANHLVEPEATCYAHSLNLCEVYYNFYRNESETAAVSAVNDLKTLGVTERNDMDEAFWTEVGKLKATHRASLADFCAIVLTKRVGGILLTSDHHELDPLAAAGVCPVEFIR